MFVNDGNLLNCRERSVDFVSAGLPRSFENDYEATSQLASKLKRGAGVSPSLQWGFPKLLHRSFRRNRTGAARAFRLTLFRGIGRSRGFGALARYAWVEVHNDCFSVITRKGAADQPSRCREPHFMQELLAGENRRLLSRIGIRKVVLARLRELSECRVS
jgi:hypothetical protein